MATLKVTDDTFKGEVLDVKETPVLVDFWAEWCGPCKMLAPVIDAISDAHGDTLKVMKLDTDKNPQTAQDYNIMSIPCCILFKDGQEVHRIIGHKNKDQFEAELTPHL